MYQEFEYAGGQGVFDRILDQSIASFKSLLGKRVYNTILGRWVSVNPLAHFREWVSPYSFVQNNPINRVGTLDNPIYDTEGNLLGTDDQGMKGDAIVMDKSKFTQGMKHDDAVKAGSPLDKAPINGEVYDKINNFQKIVPSRPDYDGFVTRREGIDWAKSHPGALGNPTPVNTLYIDASTLDFGNILQLIFLKMELVKVLQ